jgi:hypothetical protein
MNAYIDPSDETISEWLDRFGTTGAKKHVLEHQPVKVIDGVPRPAIAWYREMSLAERQSLARLQAMNEQMEAEDEFDIHRMVVASCLLWPTLEDYEKPVMAALELFRRIQQHGHGPLPEEVDEYEAGTLPDSMARDFQKTRESVRQVVDGPMASLYKELAIAIATAGGQAAVDPRLLDWLFHLPPGRLREVAAQIEAAHGMILQSSHASIEELPEGQQAEAFRELQHQFYSPFDFIDESLREYEERQMSPNDQPENDPDDEDEADDEPADDFSHDAFRDALEGL